MKSFIISAVVAALMALDVTDVQAQWEIRPWETEFEWHSRLQGARLDMYRDLDARLAEIRNRPPRHVPPSPHLPDLFGAWLVHSRDASGTTWTGRVVFGSNFRLSAAFRGTTTRGVVTTQNFTAGFTYAANGNILVVPDRASDFQINRITWHHRNRFVVTPQRGAPLLYDRLR